ncbi:MAG TPA: PL29 family lyase N-terminal domain-containing protein, partial [Clostridia bacterium]|nr:PL29 family lyase N-terminal domain-containing protein [Clostridia bacterium]
TTGADAVTPLLKISDDGYWMISYNKGDSYSYITDLNNNNVSVYPATREIDIKLAKPELQIVISASQSSVEYGSNLKINYSFKNTGNTDFTNVRVYDTSGNQLLTVDSLPQKSATQTRSVTTGTLTASRSFKFRISGKDEKSGKEMTFYSNELNVEVKIDPNNINLEVAAVVDRNMLETPDEVNFTITVRNKSTFEVTDISVYSGVGNRTLVGSISRLAPDESREIKCTDYVNQTTAFNFIAIAKDAEGNDLEFPTSHLLWVEVESDIPIETPTSSPSPGESPTQTPIAGVTTPAPTPIPEKNSDKTSSGNQNIFTNTILYIFAVLVILMVVSGVVYVILWIIERRYQKKHKSLYNGLK